MTKELLANLWKKFDFSLETLGERIRLQKTIFLLKQLNFAGLEEYKYSWYIYGPYSSRVATDAFAVRDEKLFESASMQFSDSQNIAIKKLNAILTSLDNQTNSDQAKIMKYELMADIIFLKKQKKEKEEIFTELSNKRKDLGDRSFFDAAWTICNINGLI